MYSSLRSSAASRRVSDTNCQRELFITYTNNRELYYLTARGGCTRRKYFGTRGASGSQSPLFTVEDFFRTKKVTMAVGLKNMQRQLTDKFL